MTGTAAKGGTAALIRRDAAITAVSNSHPHATASFARPAFIQNTSGRSSYISRPCTHNQRD
jgi:hypothetical protein